MRRTLLGLLAALAVGASTTLVAAPAQAATKPVTIKKISNQSIDWFGSALVKPNVKKAKNVKVTKKRMTIYQGSKIVRKNRGAAKLAPGSYRITTKVSYTFKGKKRVAVAKQRLIVKQGRCATVRNFGSLKVDPSFSPTVAGDSVPTVARKLHTGGASSDVYTPQEVIAMLQLFKAMVNEPEFNALIDAAIAELQVLIERGVTRLEDRLYQGCGKQDIDVYATFANGELMSAEDDSEFMMSMSGARAALSAQR